MVKRLVGLYSNEFRRACVERMKQCDDISALSRGDFSGIALQLVDAITATLVDLKGELQNTDATV